MNTGICVGHQEASANFSELLERVANGDEITITRHGAPPARLVPIQAVSTAASRREAIQKIRQLATAHRLAGIPLNDLKNEGRR